MPPNVWGMTDEGNGRGDMDGLCGGDSRTRLFTAVRTARMEGTDDMKSLLQKLVRASVVAGLSLVATFSAVAQDEAPGIVRITKPSTAAVRSPQVMQTGFAHGQSPCPESTNGDCPQASGYRHGFGCQYGRCPHGMGFGHGGCPTCQSGCCRNQCSQGMVDYFRCKFGYFIPTGAGGAGAPFCGKYSRVYPQDPHYFDQRDGQAWGAQGYGLPMAVPLAPVVGHTYNYGWGSPSSRLTPISRPAY